MHTKKIESRVYPMPVGTAMMLANRRTSGSLLNREPMTSRVARNAAPRHAPTANITKKAMQLVIFASLDSSCAKMVAHADDRRRHGPVHQARRRKEQLQKRIVRGDFGFSESGGDDGENLQLEHF
eukprot:CAMPEP_0175824658 /NCGR_PEP_ID=MMETSP0107_2-20121207/10840_1 /TAXON_ID=195067 ORGANISM="Goniomonas pacifica, Strain CCMP1869" /NCGR_SAMPLE_ID=MMETSP0107_2 /ASSEMBLY_ACC=CAM_ASM_000203 /LENGTH=124 /DNA_ID=CAMNT_0017137227 /DNA_START=333 /DNA_END=706 /DNA_ORIENTATION=+